MHSCKGRSVIFCDPPFGALMEPLLATLNKLKQDLKDSEAFLMVTLPYFIGKKLIQAAPQLHMLDYKVFESLEFDRNCVIIGDLRKTCSLHEYGVRWQYLQAKNLCSSVIH